MAKTFKEIRLMLADIYMSNIDADDMTTDDEEKAQVIRSLDSTHTELMGKYAYDFLVKRKSFSTIIGQNSYSKPDGQILNIHLGTKELSNDEFGYLLPEVSGSPDRFWFSDNQKKIILYPTPSSASTIHIRYLDYRYALDEDNMPTTEYADNNTINMPERVQQIYIEWLLYQTLGDYMRNQSKPRWEPTLAIAENKKQIFLQQWKSYDGEVRFII